MTDNAAYLGKRITRLADLALGLTKEIGLLRSGDGDPLTDSERQAYIGALNRVVDGLNDAQMELAKAEELYCYRFLGIGVC